MTNIHIFKDELDISDLIKSASSIAYAAEVNKLTDDQFKYLKPSINQKLLTKADIKDTEDLYYTSAILVSSCINKNDDCFTGPTIWAARKTPVDKSANIDHIAEKIVGHVTNAWSIDERSNLIDESTKVENLPNSFHILIGSVIYKLRTDNEEYNKTIASLIESIENNLKFISMECAYSNFSYGLSKGNEFKIINRNDETSFLTKTLRAYGGTGQYQDYKICRVLEDIQFTAFSFVDRPANPDSIIFTKDSIPDFAKASKTDFIEKTQFLEKDGVSSNSIKLSHKESFDMSEVFIEQNKELKAKNEMLEKEVASLKEQFTKSNVSKLEKEIETLKAQSTDLGGDLKSKSEALVAKEIEAKELQTKFDELSKAKEDLAAANKDLAEKICKIEADQKIQDRISTLVGGGFSIEDAEAEVKTFAALDDAQFKAVAIRIIEAAKYSKEEKKDDEKKEEKKVDASTVDTSKITDKEVTSAKVDETIDETFNSIVKNLTAALKSGKVNGDK